MGSILSGGVVQILSSVLVIGLAAGCASHGHGADAGGKSVAAADLRPTRLRCEYLDSPIGIDETTPRFSWELLSDHRNQTQSAYEVLVASSPETLAKDTGDLWTSGRIESNDTAHVVYAGTPLTSRQTGFWKVRSYDATGAAGPWSPPAMFEMGLLQPADWQARFITAPPVPLNADTPAKLTIKQARYETLYGETGRDVTQVVADAVRDNRLNLRATNATLGGDAAPQQHKQLRVEYEEDGLPQTAVVREGATLTLPRTSLPYLRKGFTLRGPVKSARLYATALGLYEMFINGQRVGNHVLAPEWTDYDKRLEYQTFDVTGVLKPGANAIGALVANGWYAGHIGNGGYQKWGKTPALSAQLEITYADGFTERVLTDDSWLTHASPITASDFMLGEEIDARRTIANWNKPGLNEAGWQPAVERGERRNLVARRNEPVVVSEILTAKTVKQIAPGRYVYDMGQNMVGVVRLKVAGKTGTTVTLRHAEMLNADGTMYLTNLRGAPSVDTFTLSGQGEEVFQPHFTFHGFRYVEVSGVSEAPPIEAVNGLVIESATPPAGEFACSDERINQLQSNIVWGQRGNYLSVPTDCPQRDERLGWMGDAQVFIKTATYNRDVAAFFTKWLVDVDDAQKPDGRFADVSPDTMGNAGAPAWADAGVICPWTIYQVYGDKRVLEQHLPAMTKWVEYCRANSTGLIRDKGRNSDFGDWLSIGANTPKEVIGTAYFGYVTHLLSKSYAAVGNETEAAKYAKLFDEIKAAFTKKYVSADGHIQGDTQCVYLMALKFDLVPQDLRPKIADLLVKDIQAKGNHLSTGFVGVSYLLPTLTSVGQNDLAYTLLFQDTFPSWLFSVKHGATTIWERWDGWTPDKGFQDPGMNSFNHYSLGSCGEWLYETVAGIGQAEGSVGFDKIVIQPRPTEKLTWAKASYRSINGLISSEWKKDDKGLRLRIEIPVNTTAKVILPAKSISVEEGKNAVRTTRLDGDETVFEVGSGVYEFVAAMN